MSESSNGSDIDDSESSNSESDSSAGINEDNVPHSSNEMQTDQAMGSSANNIRRNSENETVDLQPDSNLLLQNDIQWKNIEFRAMDQREIDGLRMGRKSAALKPGTLNLNAASPKLLYFQAFFLSSKDIKSFVAHTNERLNVFEHSQLSNEEFMKVVALLLLQSRYPGIPKECLFGEGDSASRWAGLALPDFRKYMSLSRHNYIMSNLSFSALTLDEGAGELIEDGETVYRGNHEVDPLIESFYRGRSEYLSPGERLCVGECMSKWRGKDTENYTNGEGMLQVPRILRKPEPGGAKMKSIADCETGIMLGLEFHQARHDNRPREYDVAHSKSTAVVMRLCKPWAGSGRTVFGDSFFASVRTSVALKAEHGLYFIGPVKTATSGYPKSYIEAHFVHNNIPPGTGDSLVLATEVPNEFNPFITPVFATAWNDMKLKMFVSTCGSSTTGTPHIRSRHRLRMGATPQSREEQSVRRDKTVQEYLDNSGAIDKHNRFREGMLALEDTIQTRKWRVRIFCTILGMSITDAYLAYMKFSSDPSKFDLTFIDFVLDIVDAILHPRTRESQEQEQHASSQSTPHELRGLTQLNREMAPEERWKRENPCVRCKDCKGPGRSKLAAKYCIVCTSINAENDDGIKRKHVHGVCLSCQASHNFSRGASRNSTSHVAIIQKAFE